MEAEPHPSPGKKRKERREPIAILHRGEGYAVIAKPAGWSVTPDRKDPFGPLLMDAVAERLGVEGVEPVHRLDKGTSGCLLVSDDGDAHRHLSKQFRKRKVTKRYLALVRGVPAASEGHVKTRMEKSPRPGSRMRTARQPEKGKPPRKQKIARTSYRTLIAFRGYALLECTPITGRQHQIRVHMSHIGHPLAVDPLYGGEDALRLSSFKRGYKPSTRRHETALMDRLTLHAWKLGFEDPAGHTIHCRAPLPADLRLTLAKLLRFGK